MTTLVRTSIRAFLVSAVAWVVVSVAAHAETVNQTRFEVARVELLRRVGRPEAVAPLAALLRLDDFVPAGALRAVLHQVADDRRSDPLVAAQAAYHLAVADENGGDAAAGARGWRALGLLDTFQVIGPFDAQGRSGLARHYPPEDLAGQAAMDVLRTARYPGKEREVTWRVADGVCRQGALLLGALLTPDTDAVAYALTFVRSGHAGPAVLRLGSAGPIKVWLNGQVVLDENVVHPPALDQHAAAVTLAAGDNVLLVKTVITAGAWRLFVRFTDDAGRPLPNVAAHNDGAATVRQSVPTPKKAARALGPLLQARAKASRGPARSAAWLDYARLLTLVPDQDADKKAVEGALRTSLDAAESVEALSLLAEVAPTPISCGHQSVTEGNIPFIISLRCK